MAVPEILRRVPDKDPKALPLDPRKPFHVKFSSQVLCGAQNVTTCLITEGYRIEVDAERRFVVVSRNDAHDREDSTLVPFENVSYIRYEKGARP